MAEYHLHAQILKRSEGKSAVACAAYRAGERLHDERYRCTWNFARKGGVMHSEIIAPEGTPTRLLDRQTLWNEVEAVERYKNAQLAKEFDVALPVELSPEAQRALVRAFVRDHFVSQGLICDFAIHRAEPENPHFHLMVPLRTVHEEGFSRLKVRDWENKAEQLLRYREAWAHYANRALAEEGHRARIDHRSYAERGVVFRPQPKLYRKRQHALRDGRDHVTDREGACVHVDRHNRELALAEPHALLRLLTSTAPTFSEHDLLRALNRYVDDPESFQIALARLKSSPELVPLGADDRGMLHYSTREVVRKERSILDDAHVVAQRAFQRVRNTFVEQAILLAPRALTPEQVAALHHITTGSDLAIVEGYAGTGKSTLLDAARVAWEAQGLTVLGGALSGKAAENLERDSKIPSRTLHGWQWHWKVHGQSLTSRHVLVIDEAAMVGTDQFREILAVVRDAGAKLVLVGDTRQLQAIDPGAPMRLLKQHYAPATLATVIRQRGHRWQRVATKNFAEGSADVALRAYADHGRLHGYSDLGEAKSALVAAWARDRESEPGATSLILAFRRKDVRALNELARDVRRTRGELGEDHRLATLQGDRHFGVGDRIFFLKNDRTLGGHGVKNGTLGTIERIEGSELVVRLDDQRQLAFDAKHYNAIDHGYAGTIHKSQGSTVDRTYVLASRYMDASASYVALSRHRKDAALFYSAGEFESRERLVSALARERVKPMAHELLDGGAAQDALSNECAARILAAQPAERGAALEALRALSARAPRSAAEMLERLPEVKARTEVCRDAELQRAHAKARLRAFEQAHPTQARLRTASYRVHAEAVVDAERALERATSELAALRLRASVRASAQRLAARHNAPIEQARVTWRALLTSLEDRRRQHALTQIALRDNADARTLRVRALSERDAGSTFAVERERIVNGERVLYLRPDRGELLVIAYPEQCAETTHERSLRTRHVVVIPRSTSRTQHRHEH